MDTYPAFITTERISQARIPISGERIVITLGVDEQTGRPIELSISLQKQPDNSVRIFATREPAALPAPRLTTEDMGWNIKRVHVTYQKMRPASAQEWMVAVLACRPALHIFRFLSDPQSVPPHENASLRTSASSTVPARTHLPARCWSKTTASQKWLAATGALLVTAVT